MKLLFTIFILFFVLTANSQVIVPDGTIDGEIWKKSFSPYYIDGNIIVKDLTIEPGVSVIFTNLWGFRVDGKLIANGTMTDSIFFKGQTDTTFWKGLHINSGAIEAKLSYCIVEGAINQGLFVQEDVLEVNNSIVSNNNGYGISILSSYPKLNDVTITHNSSNGLYISSGGVSINNSLISENSLNGIYISNGSATIQNSIIKQNSLNGFLFNKANVNITNSLIFNNEAAGILTSAQQDYIYLINCVIADNDSIGVIGKTVGKLTIDNSIIYNNESSLDVTTVPGKVIVNYSNVQGIELYPGTGNIRSEPSFEDTLFYRLNPLSPCIDRGNPNNIYNDVYFPPSQGTIRNDMGAYGGPLAGNWIETLTVESNLLDFGNVGISEPLSQPLVIKNFTDADVNVSDISFSGTDAEYYSIADTSFSIASQDSHTTEITFSPNAERVFNADATILDDMGSIKIRLTGQGTVPVINLPVTQLDFDSVAVSSDSLKQLTISNTGQANLIVYKDSLNINGKDSSQFVLGSFVTDLVIPPANSAQIDITFAPSDSGKMEAVLNIASNDPVNPLKQVTLSGTGIKPIISHTTHMLDFDIVDVGKDSILDAYINNSGSADLIVFKDNLEIIGPNASEFILQMPTEDPLIAAGDSSALSVQFVPADSGHKEATLKIYSNDTPNSPYEISLLGIGHTQPIMHISDDSLDFGDLAISEDSVIQFTIYNNGNSSLIIYKDSLNISGTEAPQFSSETWASDLEIPEKDSTRVSVTFAPIDSGYHEATLYIASNDPDNPHDQLLLTGHSFAKPVPVIMLSKTSLNFGQVVVSKDTTLSLVVFNKGQAALNIFADSLDISGTNSSEFSLESLAENESISYGDSLILHITFKPGDNGNRNALLNIVCNDPDKKHLPVPLSGIGRVVDTLLPVISVTPMELNFSNVIIDENSLEPLTIFNLGNSDLTVFKNKLKFTGSGADKFTFEGIESDLVIPGNDSKKIYIKFTPIDTTTKTAVFQISSNDINHNTVNVNVTGNGIIDPVATIALDNTVTSSHFTKGQNATIGFDITAAAAIDSAFLYYKKGGAGLYSKKSLNNQGNNVFKADLGGALLTERGLVYYVESYHKTNRTTSDTTDISVEVPELNFTEPTKANTYQLISVPVDINQQTLADLLVDDLGNYDNTQYRVFDYNADSGYVELSSLSTHIESGKAFFLITKKNQTLDLENGVSVKSSTDFQMDLKAGWNFVANPFAFPVSWSLMDSNQALRYYDGEEWPFVTVMEPFQGYAVHVQSDTTISVPPVEVQSMPKVSTPITAGADWFIQVSGSGKNVLDQYNYVGVKQSSVDAIDKNDYAEPPPIGNYLSIYFRNAAAPEEKYSTDFRAPDLKGYTFNLNVESNTSAGKSIQLFAENLPNEFDWVIVSPESKLIYGKNDIVINKNVQLQLLVGTQEYLKNVTDDYMYIPTRLKLKQNYPNPFNPETTIGFELSQQVNVNIDIYDILGRVVKTLVHNQRMDPGYYSIKWSGINNLDNRVASGIYFLHFRAGHYTKSIKMIMNN